MEDQPIRLMIIDDHVMVRKGIEAFLGEYADISVIGQASDGIKALQLVEKLNPDVILIDLLMPGIDGIKTIEKIIAVRPEQPIIVLTGYDKEDKLFQAVKAGAMGYLIKNTNPDELVRAIRTVHAGIPALSNMILWRLISQKDPLKPHAILDVLSERETEVLRLLTKGYTDQEISQTLWLSDVTIRTHISRILSKLGLKNRVQAALCGIRSGLVSLDESGNTSDDHNR